MKFVFLGTAAAEGIPGRWCGCRICTEARARGGREIRRRCAYLIDDDTMVDFGPDTFDQLLRAGVDSSRLRRIIFTHPHGDHMAAGELAYRRTPGFCSDVPEYRLDVVASKETMRELVRGVITSNATGLNVVRLFDDLRLNALVATGGEWTRSGDVEALAIPASHAPAMGAMIYAIRRGGRTLLIANDTGNLAPESLAMLENVKLDAAVLECTTAFRTPDACRNHMGFNTTVGFRKRLVEMGCLAPDAPVYVSHFSHNGQGLHDELQAKFAPHGMIVAYDGLSIEI